MKHEVDLIEQEILDVDPALLKRLLDDKSTGGNIRWCTSEYQGLGSAFYPDKEITADLLTKEHAMLIQPRTSKSPEEQVRRTRDNAEVFTPSWVCNAQNNLIDKEWFGREDVFNTADGTNWVTSESPVEFPGGKKDWRAYVDKRVLEVTCGEAPYLASRYDTVTGEEIPVKQRIGLLDRKLRVVSENAANCEEWRVWALRALQATYGYEYQGDNVLLARENLLADYEDHYSERFGRVLSLADRKAAANVIAWNIWQMDGREYTSPYSYTEEEVEPPAQASIFDLNEIGEVEQCAHTITVPVYCKIRDWRAEKTVEFRHLLQKGESS